MHDFTRVFASYGAVAPPLFYRVDRNGECVGYVGRLSRGLWAAQGASSGPPCWRPALVLGLWPTREQAAGAL